MPFTILEWFGRTVDDKSPDAERLRVAKRCPFIEAECTKQFPDGTKSGACSALTPDGPLAICPNRLYASKYEILHHVARDVFGDEVSLVLWDEVKSTTGAGNRVVAIGKRSGAEVRLPSRAGPRGGYFVDWILAKLTPANELIEFVAVEVQTMDTTGSYKPAVIELRAGTGLNWENVSKRILPQLIYKGHVLRREKKCAKGLFFICPEGVLDHIKARLGGKLLAYGMQPGAITFIGYDLVGNGSPRILKRASSFSTTVDQVALAFTSPSNLPDEGSYESAIKEALSKLR